MDPAEALRWMEAYDLWLIVIGLALLAVAMLPRMLSEKPLSMPIVVFALGFLAVALPLGIDGPDPLDHGPVTEHLTELGVIIALMGAGLKIDRMPGLGRWATTWRLLGITMVLTIAMAAFVGWQVAAFVPATAALLGAVIAPTDPVLASDVQVAGPGQGSEDEETEDTDPTEGGEEDEVRFALTSEAGLNDGLAFPFTNLAIAMAIAGSHPDNWIETWLLIDVLFKITVAVVVGLGLGWLLAALIFRSPAESTAGKAMTGLGAIAATLLIYGATEYAGGYGFIAVFLGALMIRHHAGEHAFHVPLFLATESTERLLVAVILIALGAAVAGGLLAPLTAPLIISALLIFFVVRPVAGILGLIGSAQAPWRERLFISFFGIRGIGSFYYLAFALNIADFEGERELWALVALIVVISIVVHGVLAAPLTERLDAIREKEEKERGKKRSSGGDG